jgi:hypothetical protein
VPLG